MKKCKSLDERLNVLERKAVRIETLIWYIAGSLSLKFGSDLLPMVSALMKGG